MVPRIECFAALSREAGPSPKSEDLRMDLSGYVLATLHRDSEFALCRGRGAASPIPDPPSVLVMMPASEHPAPDRVRMLEHELDLSAQLDSSWAVRPLAFAQY